MNDIDLDNKQIGERIRQRRKERGLTQERLSELIDVSKNHICAIESGTDGFSVKCLWNICRELEITPDYVLLGNIRDDSITQRLIETSKLLSEEDMGIVLNLCEYLIRRNSDGTTNGFIFPD